MREYQFECPSISAIGRERCRVPTDFALADPLAQPLNAVYAVSAWPRATRGMQHALQPMQHAAVHHKMIIRCSIHQCRIVQVSVQHQDAACNTTLP